MKSQTLQKICLKVKNKLKNNANQLIEFDQTDAEDDQLINHSYSDFLSFKSNA